MASNYNFPVLGIGETFGVLITYKSPSGAAIDVSLFSAKMQVRDHSGKLLTSLSNATGEIVLGGTAGTISLNLTPAVTATLPAGTWPYDLVLTDSNGVVSWTLAGLFPTAHMVTQLP